MGKTDQILNYIIKIEGHLGNIDGHLKALNGRVQTNTDDIKTNEKETYKIKNRIAYCAGGLAVIGIVWGIIFKFM